MPKTDTLPVPLAIALPTAPAKPPSRLKRLAMQALGYFFLVLGVAGVILPFLHGLLFLFMGLAILSQEAAWARCLRVRIAQRFPRMHQVSVEAEFRAQRWMRRIVRRFRRP